MPVHDWTIVPSGIFHDFHNSWITHIKEVLNGGLLPANYYALAEQHAGQVLTDVLTLHTGKDEAVIPPCRGSLAVAEAPPRVSRKVVPGPSAFYRLARRTLAIRHVSGHRLVAMIEIVSPANKDRTAGVRDFAAKVWSALNHGCHVLCLDLFPPGPANPHGIHEVIWEQLDAPDDTFAADKPLLLASYVAAQIPEAYLESLAVGDALPDMPLFLEPSNYINVPLEQSYHATYRGFPDYWRDVLEERNGSAS